MSRETIVATVQDASRVPVVIEDVNNTNEALPQAVTSKPSHPEPNRQRTWSLKTKIIIWAIALGLFPTLIIGVAIYLTGQSIQHQVSQTNTSDHQRIEGIQVALDHQFPWLWLGSGAIAVLSGGIATVLANRVARPILNSVTISDEMVNLLDSEHISVGHRAQDQADELTALTQNLNVIESRLPLLLQQQQTKSQDYRIFHQIIHRIRTSFFEEDILKATVEEVHQALKADRVVILRFDPHEDSIILEEVVNSGWPKALGTTMPEPCMTEAQKKPSGDVQVLAINDIYKAGLTPAHLDSLERFQIKASLIAPLMVGNDLFGWLITHQCSGSRQWQQSEMDLMIQVATHVGCALESTKLLKQFNIKANVTRVSAEITRRMLASVSEEEVLHVMVEETRKAIRTDRVIFYRFNEQDIDKVAAESVLPMYPRLLGVPLKDLGIAHGCTHQYQAGEVQVTHNIAEAELTKAQIEQLERFSVQGYLITPILNDTQLHGLLIVHQCSGPRIWKQSEIDLVGQIASQVRIVLAHTQLLEQASHEKSQQQCLEKITRRIQESMVEQEILDIAVAESRNAINADRVLACIFDANGFGTVMSETVLPGFPKALGTELNASCLTTDDDKTFQEGNVQVINNIHSVMDDAGLTDRHIQHLERFDVKASIVAPILKNGKLLGVLMAHRCSESRTWHPSDSNLIRQIADQVGSALQQVRLLGQVKQSCQQAEDQVQKEHQQKEQLLDDMSVVLQQGKKAVQGFTHNASHQAKSLQAIQHHIGTLDHLTQSIGATAQSVDEQGKQVEYLIENASHSVRQAVEHVLIHQDALASTLPQIQHLEHIFQEFSQNMESISHLTSRLKLLSVVADTKLDNMQHASCDSAVNSAESVDLTSTVERVGTLIQRLDENVETIQPLIDAMKTGSQDMARMIGRKMHNDDVMVQLAETVEQELTQLSQVNETMTTLADDIIHTATDQAAASIAANRAVQTITTTAQHLSQQSETIAQSFNHLTVLSQDEPERQISSAS